MLKKQNHIHTFRRHTYKSSGSSIFFCTDAICNYKIDCDLSLGKEVLCSRCGEPFRIDNISIRQAKPHCRNCDKRRVKDNETGKSYLVNPKEVVSEIANDRIESLKDRLSKATVDESKEDI